MSASAGRRRQFESVSATVRRVAGERPDALAVASPRGDLTYGELMRRADALTAALAAEGFAAGSLLPVLARDARESIVAMLGALGARGAFVPLDPDLPDERLTTLLAEIDGRWGYAEPGLVGRLAAHLPAGGDGACLLWSGAAGTAPAAARPGPRLVEAVPGGAPPPPLDAAPDDLAYVVFTSGSTGQPKGIAGRLAGIDHFVRWEIDLVAAGPGTRVSQLTSPSFDAVLRDVFVPLCAGGTVCVPASRERTADGAWLAAWLEEQRVEVLHCVPSLLRALLNAEPPRESFQALHHVLVAGERLLPADVRRWFDLLGERARLVNLYGPSETTMVKLFHVVRPTDAERPSIPIGKPMPGAAAMVVDERDRPCPPGVTGEILLRTPYRSLGYFRRPELTREVFVANPLSGDADDLVYRTGDLGRLLRGGELEFLGRRDHQVKVRGVRVEPGEVEDALRRHEAVRDQVVVAREDAAGEVSLCAYLVVAREVGAAELRAHCRALVPAALVPADFVVLPALPRTFSGKVDRRALPAPPAAAPADEEGGAPPLGAVEEVLAALWAEVLGRQRVARDHDFFALGGHSLMAARLLNRVAAAFDVELAMRDLAEASTVAGLAAAIGRRRGAGGSADGAFDAAAGGEPTISFAQERLWFLDQLAPGGAAYNLPSSVLLDGALRVAALEATLAEVVRRHQALRSTFPDEGGRPVLAVAPPAAPALPVADLGGLPAERREAELRRLAGEESRRAFRLDQGPLFRAALVRLEPRRHGVLSTLHHVVGDAWSTALLVREVSTLYGALAAGLPSPLAEPALSYGQWAAWQRRWLAGEAAAASLDLWRRRLAALPALLELPTDRPRPPVQRYRGGRVPLRLAPELRDRLQALARRQGTTLFTTLLGGFLVLLQRATGGHDLPVGTPMAGRRQLATEELIGLFVNSVVLRGDLSGDPTVDELSSRLRALVLEADAHQGIPFERVVEVLQPQRSLAHAPLFQVMLVLQNAPREALDLAGLRWTPLAGEPRGAKVDWTVSLIEGRGGLAGVFEYDRDLFDRVTVRRAAARFERLLAALAAAPEARLSQLDELSAAERHQLLHEWNDTGRALGGRQTIHQRIAEQARLLPQRVAVELDGASLAYGDLDRLANRLAHRLRGMGVGPEVPVGVLMERSPMLVVTLLAVLKAGGAYVPLDPSYPRERLAFMVEDARVAVLATQRSLAAELAAGSAPRLVVDDPGAGLESAPGDDPAVPLADDNLAYVIYTSGSTGRPKGAMNSHGAIRNRLLWMQEAYRLSADDRVLQKTPFSFDVSVWELFWPLMAGARLVLARPGGHRDSGYLVERIVAAGVTVLHFVPSMLQAFLDEPDLERCRSVRLVVCSGEALGGAASQRCLERLGAELHNLYGPTEAAVDVTFRACVRGEAAPAVPLGRPIANTSIHLVDRHLSPVPLGVAGELLIGGAQVGRGYHRRPGLTAERFVPDSFAPAPGARLYRTGDLARRLPDGELDYLGRIDQQVKVRGFRVELGEIEAALLRHPAVRDAAVVAHRSAGGDLRLAAYLVLSAAVEPRELAAFLVARLPEYMVPAAWVVLDALPTTPSGKLDRRALPEPAAAPRAAGAPPEGEMEEEVAAVWCEVLRTEAVGRDDDFFAIGGHSLLATQVLARLRARFGLAPTLAELFQAPTVRAVAALLEARLVAHLDAERIDEMLAQLEGLDDEQAAALERLGGEPPPGADAHPEPEARGIAVSETARHEKLEGLSPAKRALLLRTLRAGAARAAEGQRIRRRGPGEAWPLSSGQQRLWFLAQMDPSSPLYNIPTALRLGGSLHPARLARALAAVTARHEVLRTAFRLTDDGPVQEVLPARPLPLPIFDLAHLPRARREAEAARLAAAEAERPFDLARAPLLRACLVRLRDDEHLASLTVHHAVSDAWSKGILVRDLTAAYGALAAGGEPSLPPLPIQYADFAVWQRETLSGGELDRQLAYWRAELTPEPPSLDLPLDRPRPPVQSFLGASRPFGVPAPLAAAARALARREGTTLFVVLLAAFQSLLHRYSGQDDVAVGSPLAGRNRAETADLVGFFVNTVVLRTRFDGGPAFAEVVRRVHRVTVGAADHQDLPFEKLVDELAPTRDLSRTPLFQVMMVLQNMPRESLDLPGLSLRPVELRATRAKFDLTLSLVEAGERLLGGIGYMTALWDAATVDRLGGHLRVLLAAAVADPERPVARLELLSPGERQQVLREWSGTPSAEHPGECLHAGFARRVALAPDAVAVTCRCASLTYGELEERANRLAHHLLALGVGREEPVALLLERSLDLVVAMLAVLKAGAAYLPLDAGHPGERSAAILEDARAGVVVTERGLRGGLPAGVRTVVVDEAAAEIAQRPAHPPAVEVVPEQAAYVIFTSGSTGRPKGVVVPHSNVGRLVAVSQPLYGYDARAVWSVFHSFAFDYSVWEIWGALLTGARAVIVDVWTRRNPEAFLDLLRHERVTVLSQTPSAFRPLIAAAVENGGGGDLALASVVFAGEALEPVMLAPWIERWGDERPRLANMYGITETTVHTTFRRMVAADLDGASLVGGALPEWRIQVLDRRGEPVAAGVAGEICVGGAGLARGYLHRPGLTASRFVPDPFAAVPGDRLYRSGDLARRRGDGDLEYLGRIDDQIKIRGFRIEPGEIASALMSHAAVREAVVTAREEASGARRLVAYVVAAPGGDPAAADLRSYLGGLLPEHMVPSAFVTLPALPLTANGKIDRRALPAPEASGGGAFVAPRTPAEEALAAVWSEVLRVERVGVHDNFFELGGDSILSIQIVSRSARAGLRITPKQMFQHQTVAELAAVADTAPAAVAEQGPVVGELPLTPVQAWFFEPDPVDPHHHNQATMVEVGAELSPRRLVRVAAPLLAHHDALRLRFRPDPQGRWRASIAPPGGAPPVAVVDLSHLPATGRRPALERAAGDAQRGLDLAAGPLARFVLFTLGAGEASRLLVVAHHLTVDGVSWRILLEDLGTACGQVCAGAAPALPAKTTSYKAWAERLAAAAERFAGQLAAWTGGEEEGRRDPPPLPLDLPGGDDTVASTRTVAVSLDAEETAALLHQVPRAYRTQINDVLLTAVAAALARWTGRNRVLIDLEGHGREDLFDDVDLSRTVGWFTSIYPVELDLAGADGPGEALKVVKERLRAVPDRGVGYGVLRYLGQGEAARRLAALPAPEVSFNYLGQFDQVFSAGGPLAPARERRGALVSPRQRRRHRLDFAGRVVGGRLSLSCAYSAAVHQRATAQGVIDAVGEELRRLIDHCTQPGAGGVTPSDFPLVDLDQATLDELVAGADVEEIYPLSPLQQGFLFHAVHAAEAASYRQQLSCLLIGDLDVPAFVAAWQAILDRHPILRTSFAWRGLERPLQVVHRHVPVALAEEDWSEAAEGEQRRRLDAFLAADRERGFDLESPCVMRLALVRLGPATHAFAWSFHHILWDGWSFPVLIGEVFNLYRARVTGEAVELPARRPYRDYIAWLEEQSLEAAEEHWRGVLSGFTAPTPLTAAAIPPRSPERGGAHHTRALLRADVTSSLEAAARRLQLTLNTLVQGALALLLGRYTGERDVVFGVVSSGRSLPLAGIEQMVGLFINTLPVRVALPPGARVAEWLRRIQEQQTEARQFEYSPLAQVQAWSEVPRGQPLFESLLAFENFPADESMRSAGGGGLRVADVRFVEATNYPLAVMVTPGPQLAVRALYDPGTFEEVQVRRLIGHLANLLEQVAAPADPRLAALDLLSAAERHQVLREWNDTAAPVAPRLLHQPFEERAAAAPEAPAVSFGAQEVAYGELNRRANRLAHHLRRLGVGRGSAVGIHLERSAEMVEALLAVSKAGGAYVPVDAALPVARMRFILGALDATCLLTQSARLPHLDDLWEGVPRLEHVVCLDPPAAAEPPGAAGPPATASPAPAPRRWSRADLAALPADDPAPVADADDPAYVIFTSGSTGTPKGVVVRHRPVANLIDWVNRTFGVGPADRILFITSLSFDLSVYDVFGLLAAGGSIRIAAADDLRDPERLVRLLVEDGVTFWDSAPAALQQLVPAFPAQPAAASALRLVFLSGDWVPPALPERVRAAFPRAEVVALGGATEATVWSNFHRTGERDPRWVSVPYGRPIQNARYLVLDERLEPSPVGVPGDLHIGGDCLASGYTDPVASARQFLPDHFAEAPGFLYRTGDRARLWPDGEIEFLGRLDHQVKVRGFRIELGEIEAVLAALPGVLDAVVLARQDELGHTRLVAYVVAEGGAELGVGALRAGVAERLPEHMVPVAYVLLDSLPVTSNGKLDRKALPAPGAERPELEVGFAGPRTAVEARLVEIWTRVLPVDAVGIHDDFFELGGDSILSLQIVSRAAQAGLRVTTTQLFSYPTVAELAAVVSEAAATEPFADEQGTVTGEVPLTPAQHWFFAGDTTDAHHFNLSLLLEIAEAPPPAVVARAVDHLVAHHDALRLRFSRQADGSWRQRYAPPPVRGSFLCLDLGGLPEAARARALEAAAARAQASLDLAAGPLLRVLLVRFAPGQAARLLLVAHHLVVDGVSLRILLDDFAAAVALLAAGRPVALPAKTASYRRWAELLAAAAESPAVRGELTSWLDPRRAEVPPLPRDLAAEPGPVAGQRVVVAALDAETTGALLHQVPRAYRTQIDDALLAGLGEALAAWTGSRLALVELEGHGREAVGDEAVDVSRTVGWFTSFVPVLLDLRQAAGIGESLKTVKEALRAMPSRGVGRGLLRWLAAGEGAARLDALPEPEVSFNYLGQIDSTQPEGLAMRPARERAGAAQSPRRRRRYLLDVECRVVGGQLVAHLRYSDRCHRRETVEALADGFLAALRSLVEHCLEAGEGGATPSDFPLAALDQPALDRLLAEHAPVEDVYPLSPLQLGMLFHTLRDAASGVYVQQLTCSMYGDLDADAFAAAWRRLVARQPVLRTGFVWQHLDEPVQVVAAALPVTLQRLDWRREPLPAQEARLAELIAAERARGFDLERPPLMRLALVRLADDAYRFVWTHHHLLLDGWSLPLLVRELFALYEGERRGEPADLPRSRPYRDYVAWLRSRDQAAAEDFWRGYLAGFTAPTAIDGRAPGRRRDRAPESRDLLRTLPRAATEALAQSAQRLQLTLNTLVQGAWGLVLARSGGGADVVYGVVSSGRPPELPGVESMLGMFITTVPARVRVPGDARVGEWLRRLQAEQVEARQHEHSSLSEIQGWSEVPRGEPLFESLLLFENYPVGEALAGERRMSVAVRDLHMDERTNYPLNLTVMPGGELRMLLSYDARTFAATSAERLLRRFETILLALAEDPARRLDEVPVLSAAERHQVLREWNDTRVALPPLTLHELVARRAAAFPDAAAVEQGGLVLTYGELAARSRDLALRLRRRGVGPEVRVGVFLDRSPELAVTILGVLEAGGAYLPLDPALPAERLRSMVRESDVRLVVTRERLRRAVREVDATEVATVDGDLRQDEPGESAAEVPAADPGAGGLAYLLYTSGSTGKPKAVLVTHGSLVNHGTNAVRAYGLGAGDRVLQFSSIGFDMLAEDLFPTWLAGGTVVFAADMEASSPRELSAFVERAALTVLNLPTAHWSEWVADLEATGRPLPRSLRMMVIGSETLPRERVEPWRRLAGDRVAWRNAYGVTETTVAAAIHRAGRATPAAGPEAPDSVPIGRPIANFELYVLDAALRPVPIGAAGELAIGGAGVARGYSRRRALTAERFVPDPHGGRPGDRLYRTGDLVRALPDGQLEFLGRLDHQVKIRGFRVEPGEIEAALGGLPEVREAVVLLRQEGGDPHLVAYVVPSAAGTAIGELRSALRQRLPDYMVPASFVLLEALPLTVNGKIDRRALPVPGEVGAARDRELVPPSNETERIVAGVWQGVLGVAEIGIHDDFFDLGGHSLLATRVLTRVRDAFDVELTLRDVFEHPTVAGFAEHLLSRRLGMTDAGELGEMVAELEGLSEEEVAALLAGDDEELDV